MKSDSITRENSPDGGIGRRRRLKIFGQKWHAGSSPALGTTPNGLDLLGLLATGILVGLLLISQFQAKAGPPTQLPELTYPFPDQQEFWINSPPIADKDLRGQVVVVMFWTYGCYNCKNALPWINGLQAKLDNNPNLKIIGVHTPEFDYEKVKDNVRAQTAKFDIEFPIMIDNDFVYWKELRNRWWPAFYIADKQGKLRGAYVGEVHSDTPKSNEIEQLIASLLVE